VTDAPLSSIADDLKVIDQRHRLLAESANDVIWTMSVTGEITYVSPSVEALRGITPEQAMAQSLEEIHPPDSMAKTIAYFTGLQEALAEGRRPEPFRGEMEYYCADGSTIWCDLRVVPYFSEDGRLLEILGVSQDITERKRQQEALIAAQEEAAAARLDAERERARKEERDRLARDLHDDLLQTLAAVKGYLGMLDADGSGDDARARKYLERSRGDLTRAIESARRLVRGRGPADLEDLGAVGALSALCDHTAERHGVAVEFMCACDLDRCPSHVAEAIYRVAQEGLNNAGRHAGASRVTLSLEDAADGGIDLRVADDGRGLAADAREGTHGFGIEGMRKRLDALGGTLEVGPGPAGGTVVAARVPRAVRAAARGDRDVLHAGGAGGDLGLLAHHAQGHLHNEEQHERDEHEGDDRADERPIGELRAVEREHHVVEAHIAGDGREQRHDEGVDERLHQDGEGRGQHEGHGHLEQVVAECERLEVVPEALGAVHSGPSSGIEWSR